MVFFYNKKTGISSCFQTTHYTFSTYHNYLSSFPTQYNEHSFFHCLMVNYDKSGRKETMINQEPKAINLFKMQSNGTIPSIKLEGTYLYKINFFPGKLLAAEIYENQIIIRPVFENEPIRFRI